MNKVPGVDMTSGSLGQGLSVANGMALASKMDQLGNRVYCSSVLKSWSKTCL